MKKIKSNTYDVLIFLEKYRFYIPSYQRGYAWKEETALKLLDDIIKHFEDKASVSYYMGNILTYNRLTEDNSSELVVVDGQQRITTFMLLITALRMAVNESVDLLDKEKEEIDNDLHKYIFSKSNRNEKTEKLRLFSKRNDVVSEVLNSNMNNVGLNKNVWYKNISNKYKETNYFKNLMAFYKKISSRFITKDDYLKFIKNLEDVIFINIDIRSDSDVHKVFENINSTGVSLNLTDLTKNFLYILLEEKKKENRNNIKNYASEDELIKYNEQIEESIANTFDHRIPNIKVENDVFVTNYLIFLRGEHFNKTQTKEVYKQLKDSIRKQMANGQKELKDIINEVKEQLSLIEYIEEFSVDNSSGNNIYNLSLFLNRDNLTSVFFPFIYQAAKEFNSFKNSVFEVNPQFEDFIILIDKFFSRRMLTNRKSKNFNKYMPTLLKNFKNLEDHDINSIKDILTLKEGEENSSLMPSEREMLKYYRDNKSPYLKKTSKELKHILFRINYFLSLSSKEGISLTDDEYKKYTIEHVMPQNPKEDSKWLEDNRKAFESLDISDKERYEDEMDYYDECMNNWGNLTITQDNANLSNKEYKEKRKILSSSVLTINSSITKHDNWTNIEIEQRKSELREIIKKHF